MSAIVRCIELLLKITSGHFHRNVRKNPMAAMDRIGWMDFGRHLEDLLCFWGCTFSSDTLIYPGVYKPLKGRSVKVQKIFQLSGLQNFSVKVEVKVGTFLHGPFL